MDPFSRALGTNQGRIVPQGYAAVEGQRVFVLGYDTPGRFEPLADGDHVYIEQTATFPTGAKILRFRARVRPPVNAPPLPWTLTCTVDNVVVSRVFIEPGRVRDLVDLGVNVSKFSSGAHVVRFILAFGEAVLGFDYANVPGYIVDISADNVVHAGGTVSAFMDVSGNAHNFACPNQPVFESTGWGNGTAAVLFDGVNDYAVCDTSLAQNLVGGNDTSCTLYLVAQQVTNPPANSTLLGFGNTSDTDPIVRWNVSGSGNVTFWKRDDGGGLAQSSNINIGTTPHLLAIIYSGTSYTVRLDGVTVDSGTINVGVTTVNRVAIAALVRDSVGGFVNLRFKRMIGYTAEHAAPEYTAVEAALMAEYF